MPQNKFFKKHKNAKIRFIDQSCSKHVKRRPQSKSTTGLGLTMTETSPSQQPPPSARTCSHHMPHGAYYVPRTHKTRRRISSHMSPLATIMPERNPSHDETTYIVRQVPHSFFNRTVSHKCERCEGNKL